MEQEKQHTIDDDDHTSRSRSARLYTVSQAAAILQVAEVWIYERTRKRAIPHRKLGKHVRFTDSDLSAILRMYSRGPQIDTGIEEQVNA